MIIRVGENVNLLRLYKHRKELMIDTTPTGTEVKEQKRRWLSTVALFTAAFADWCENDTLSILWPSISR